MVVHVFEEGELVLVMRREAMRKLIIDMHLLENIVLHLCYVQSLEWLGFELLLKGLSLSLLSEESLRAVLLCLVLGETSALLASLVRASLENSLRYYLIDLIPLHLSANSYEI